MPVAKVARPRAAMEAREHAAMRVPTLILALLVLVAVALVYVWSHLHNTQLKYRIAEEMTVRENLTEENRRLKMEIATLKSPQRIESIAREKLRLQYPEREQVVLIK
ncbi:MAG: cell division protein FtsL [Syntrophobacterales bacterium]|nr:cell division protein FtsL [Syntrophobacterales bacterium]